MLCETPNVIIMMIGGIDYNIVSIINILKVRLSLRVYQRVIKTLVFLPEWKVLISRHRGFRRCIKQNFFFYTFGL